MRRRPNPSSTSSWKTENGKERKRSSTKGDDQADHQPIVTTGFVVAVVVFFVSMAFLQNHYQESRALDPFSGIKLSGGFPKISRTSSDRSLDRSLGNPKSLLSPTEDASLERDKDGIRYHLIFSTDCSPYQHWQSYLVYYTAMRVRQPGHVTRIASGCEEEQAQAMKDWFQKDVAFMSERFHLQLTPHFSGVKNDEGKIVGDYKFFNKPFGLKYWMENAPLLQYNDQTSEFPSSVQEDVVILIDPDMGLLRPITSDFSNDKETVIAKRRLENIVARRVGPGKPFAQVYAFGVQWARLDLAKIAGPDSPAIQVKQKEGGLYYPVGPPYLATVHDMYRIARKWTEFVPRVHEQYPHLLAEMFAFCIAAAHLELPHQLIDSLMISSVSAGGEGWPLVDQIPSQEVCGFARHADHETHPLPSVVHLCQRYGMGEEWFFSKRAIPSDIYDCETPLFAEPPSDLAVQYGYMQMPFGQNKTITPDEAKRHSFLLCFLFGLLNEAATFYKQAACPPDKINLAKTRNLVEYMKEHRGKNKQKH